MFCVYIPYRKLLVKFAFPRSDKSLEGIPQLLIPCKRSLNFDPNSDSDATRINPVILITGYLEDNFCLADRKMLPNAAGSVTDGGASK